MNKMIKRIKDDSDMFVFWWIRKKETKKMIQKFVWKIKKNVRIHDDFFQKRWDYLYRKKHNCFLNDCIVSVSAGGRYKPLGVWPLINEQCHAHFRDLCPAHNKMSVPPTYLPPKKFLLKDKSISLNFCGLKKNCENVCCMENSRIILRKKIMHQNLRCIYEDFFANHLHTSTKF